MNKITFLSIFLILLFSCEKDKICVDPSLIQNVDTCIEIYAPVCGCNGITYVNYCYADRSGVLAYSDGACEN